MIEFCQVPYPEETMQARRDFAFVRGERLVDPPYWFTDTETGIEYAGIFGCVAWPAKVSSKDQSVLDPLPGYGAIVGVQREDEKFRLLEEIEVGSPKVLIEKLLAMREKWGFGIHPSILPVFIGDHILFCLTVAQVNSDMIEVKGEAVGENDAFMVSPPDDFERPNHFDIYFRQLEYVLSKENKRLIFGKSGEILQKYLHSFARGNPAVMGVGGLVHTLLGRKPWKEELEETTFMLLEEE